MLNFGFSQWARPLFNLSCVGSRLFSVFFFLFLGVRLIFYIYMNDRSTITVCNCVLCIPTSLYSPTHGK